MTTDKVLRNPSDAPDQPRWAETLRDGSQVVVRPLLQTDREAERTFIESLSPESRHFRFLCTIGHPSEALLDTLTHVDQVHKVAFAAVVHEDAHERIVGVSRYTTERDQRHAECAVTVADEWQDKGLGTALMRHLIDFARARGVIHMRSVDSAHNLGMRALARFFGFHVRVDPSDASQVIYELLL
jgi:GNAT superfamily N-acetyltransferase